MSKHRLPPGPGPLATLGSLPEFRKDLLKFCSTMFTKYGDTVSFRFGLFKTQMSRSPEYISHILKKNPENYKKSFAYDLMKPIFGDGLLISHGEHWKENRTKMQSAFGTEQLKSYEPKIHKLTDQLLNEWKTGEWRNAQEDIVMLTLGIIGDCLFGEDIRNYGPHVSQAMIKIMQQVDYQILHPVHVPLWVSTSSNKEYARAIETIESIARSLVDVVITQKHPQESSKTLLARLLPQGEVTPEVRKNLRDQIMTLLITGHDTSANVLAFALQELHQRPELLNNLRESLNQDGSLSNPLLSSFINEMMRLYPPVWMASRTALADDQFGEWDIPAKSLVIINPYSLHRHPDLWTNPDAFDAERFMKPYRQDAFIPFGAGPRACVAMGLGTLEMKIILKKIILEMDFELQESSREIIVHPTLTLKPKNKVMIRMKPRKS